MSGFVLEFRCQCSLGKVATRLYVQFQICEKQIKKKETKKTWRKDMKITPPIFKKGYLLIHSFKPSAQNSTHISEQGLLPRQKSYKNRKQARTINN